MNLRNIIYYYYFFFFCGNAVPCNSRGKRKTSRECYSLAILKQKWVFPKGCRILEVEGDLCHWNIFTNKFPEIRTSGFFLFFYFFPFSCFPFPWFWLKSVRLCSVWKCMEILVKNPPPFFFSLDNTNECVDGYYWWGSLFPWGFYCERSALGALLHLALLNLAYFWKLTGLHLQLVDK